MSHPKKCSPGAFARYVSCHVQLPSREMLADCYMSSGGKCSRTVTCPPAVVRRSCWSRVVRVGNATHRDNAPQPSATLRDATQPDTT